MTPEESRELRGDISNLREDIADLKAMIRTEGDRCPYREDIARSTNNRRQIERNTEAIGSLTVSNAKMAVLLTSSSGLGGIIVAVASFLMRGA